MRLKDISFSEPQENILFDELLLRMADQEGAGEVLRFWESPRPFIVLGLTGIAQDDIHLDQAAIDQVPVHRRGSGGGTVVQGPGCLNYCLVLHRQRDPALKDVRASYRWISQRIIASLSRQQIAAVFEPVSDIALADSGRKFSGNAQRRGRDHLMHHGTILYDFDLEAVSRWLRMPKEQPQYRNHRSHKDFIANIRIDVAKFKKDLGEAFDADARTEPLSVVELERLRQTFSK